MSLAIMLTLGTLVMAMAMVIAIAFPAIREHFKYMMAKKPNMAMFRLIGLDNRIRTYVKKMDKIVEIDGGTFVTDPEYITYEKNIPVLTYFVGDAEPVLINLKKTDKLVKKDPKHLSSIFMRVKALGAMQNSMDQKKVMMFIMVTMFAIFAVGILVFQTKANIDIMVKDIATIKALVAK